MKKKNQILKSALDLFSTKGFDASSTRLIAEKAGVSEGLIFKHFKNKQDLLNYLIIEEVKLIQLKVDEILNENDAEEVLRKTLALPLSITEEEKTKWRFVFKEKWRQNQADLELFPALKEKLMSSFEMLEYYNPEKEAKLLHDLTETNCKNQAFDKVKFDKDYHRFLLIKYAV